MANISAGDDSLIRTAHAALVELAQHPGDEDPEDPSSVQAMPIVLHMPKADPPERLDLLAAAASACALVCLDPRAGTPDSPWQQALSHWYGAKIRKVARRARGKAWETVRELPGREVSIRGAQAKAFLPGPVSDTDRRIAKLQIQGTELPHPTPAPPIPEPSPLRPVIFVDLGLGMTAGKAAAQVGHASMLYAALLSPDQAVEWFRAGCPVDVREITAAQFSTLGADLAKRQQSSEDGLKTRWITAVRGATPALEIRDAGHTEIAPGSATVIASGAPLPELA